MNILGFDHKHGSAYIPMSKSNSSKRTQAAFAASDSMLCSKSKKRRKRKKLLLRQMKIQDIKLPTDINTYCKNIDTKSSSIMVFDGGVAGSPTTMKPNFLSSSLWQSISISSGELHTVFSVDPSVGVAYPKPKDVVNICPPPFILCPRSDTLTKLNLKDTSWANSLFDSAKIVESNQSVSTRRHCHIFGDDDKSHKYAGNYGLLPNRASVGISPSAVYRKTPQEHTSHINTLAQKMENIYKDYGHVETVENARSASKLISHPTLDGCELYSGVALGTNKYLQCHTDKDFTCSMVTLLKREQYSDVQRIVGYFCFPRLGIAVGLRPGDVLIFNPQEPHALSSRVYKEDELICLSVYLKSAVIGLNDNSLRLTQSELKLVDKYLKS